jgi:hypothetical protein
LYLPGRRANAGHLLETRLGHREGTPPSRRSTGLKHCSKQNEADGKTLTDILDNASARRAEVIALALALGAHEGMLGDAWRYPSATKARYLAKLVEWDYQPSEIEQTVIDYQENDDDLDDES